MVLVTHSIGVQGFRFRFQRGVGQKLDGVDPKLFGRLVRNTKKQTDLGWLGGHSFKLSFNLVTHMGAEGR